MRRRRRTKKFSRRKLLRYLSGFGLLAASIVFCIFTVQLPASTAVDNSPLAVLARTPIPELAAQTVSLVQAAPADAKVSVLTNALWAVGGLARPGAMPFVISALCRANTNLADVAVGTAIEMNGAPAMTIITVAAAAAPGMLDKIAHAAFTAAPEDFQDIAMALIYRGTTTSTNILQNLCEAVPALEPYVDTARVQAADILADENYRAATNLAAQAAAELTNQTDMAEATNQTEVDPSDHDDLAAQAMAALADEIKTNQDIRHLYLVVGYAKYAITNSGLTVENILTNTAGTTNMVFTNIINGTNLVFTNTVIGTNSAVTNRMPDAGGGTPPPVSTNVALPPPKP